MTEVATIAKEMTPGAYGIWLIAFGLLATLVKVWPALRRLSLEADGSLRADLLARIAKLEKDAIEERRTCEERISAIAAERDADRHAFNEQTEKFRAEVAGLHRLLIQFQQSSGQAISLPSTTHVPHVGKGEE